MATKYWMTGVNGDFADAADWIGGAPAASDNATINANGSYTVTLDTAQTLKNLTVGGAGTHLLETATGSLTASFLTVDQGAYVTLNGAAQIGGVQLDTGTLRINSAAAFNGEQVEFAGPSALVAGANFAVSNIQLNIPSSYFEGAYVLAATAGKTVTVTGSITTIVGGCSIQFGAKGDTGTVLFDVGGVANSYEIDVAYGAMRLGANGAANIQYLRESVGKGATIDLAGHDAGLRLTDFLNSKGRASDGTISNSTGLATLDFSGVFHGKLTGDMDVNFADGAVLGGTVSIAGDATVEGALTLVGAGSIAAGFALTGSDSTDASLLYSGKESLTLSGAITGAGGLTHSGAGILTLTHANSYSGGSQLAGGVTYITSGAALGSGAVGLTNGTLIATASVTLANDLQLLRSGVVAAATGEVLTLAGKFNGYDYWSTLTIGATGAAGTVVDAFTSVGINTVETVVVAHGTLAFSGVAGSDAITANAGSTTVKSGAVLDLAGTSATVSHLLGSGSVVSSGASVAHLTLNGGDFDGVISGNVAVEIGLGDSTAGPGGGVTLTGANTYAGGTTIDADAALALGDGGKTGSLSGAIVDNGVLIVNHVSNLTLANAISGSGSLIQNGAGATTLTGANTYSGGTVVNAGTLSVANGAELGTGYVTVNGGVLSSAGGVLLGIGDVTLAGGELLYRTTATVSDSILVQEGGGTLAAGHGATVTFTGSFEDDYGPSFTFGDSAGHDGVIVFNPMADPEIAEAFHIAAGVLRFGGAGAAALFEDCTSLTVDAGATLDLNGYLVGPYGPNTLSGAGALTNSSATAATLTIYQNVHSAPAASTFAGAVSGKLTLEVENNLTLTGAGSFTVVQIDGGASVTIGAAASTLR